MAAWDRQGTAVYRWTSVFAAEDSARDRNARDTSRNGPSGTWRSITPEIAQVGRRGTLLSVMSCVNGTGGCSQAFILRQPNGPWRPVRQTWLDQLPSGDVDRIRHGARIDPRTLQGEAGFYADGDPNCCPSQRLVFRLAVRGDSLTLLRHALVGPADSLIASAACSAHIDTSAGNKGPRPEISSSITVFCLRWDFCAAA
jgi:hypothetical protein